MVAFLPLNSGSLASGSRKRLRLTVVEAVPDAPHLNPHLYSVTCGRT